jgi:hypothetical protein
VIPGGKIARVAALSPMILWQQECLRWPVDRFSREISMTPIVLLFCSAADNAMILIGQSVPTCCNQGFFVVYPGGLLLDAMTFCEHG